MPTALTPEGFTTEGYQEIYNRIAAAFKREYGEQFDTSPESEDGVTIGIFAQVLADQSQMAGTVYHSYDIARNEGNALDQLTQLNRVRRITETATTDILELDGVVGTLVPAGSRVGGLEGLEFTTNDDVLLPGQTIGTCTEIGAVQVVAGELTNILDPIEGWDSVTNLGTVNLGVERETDSDLRSRYTRSIAKAGSATAEAIYAATTDLNLEFIAVIVNDTMTTNAEGVPPKSVMVVAEGGITEEIAERVYQTVTAGIEAYGSEVVTVYDSHGYPNEIGITRPSAVNIDVEIEYHRPDSSPIGAVADIQAAAVNHINQIGIAEDVLWANIFPPVMSVANGVIVKSIKIRRDADPFGTESIPISTVEKARTTLTAVTMTEVG